MVGVRFSRGDRTCARGAKVHLDRVPDAFAYLRTALVGHALVSPETTIASPRSITDAELFKQASYLALTGPSGDAQLTRACIACTSLGGDMHFPEASPVQAGAMLVRRSATWQVPETHTQRKPGVRKANPSISTGNPTGEVCDPVVAKPRAQAQADHHSQAVTMS